MFHNFFSVGQRVSYEKVLEWNIGCRESFPGLLWEHAMRDVSADFGRPRFLQGLQM